MSWRKQFPDWRDRPFASYLLHLQSGTDLKEIRVQGISRWMIAALATCLVLSCMAGVSLGMFIERWRAGDQFLALNDQLFYSVAALNEQCEGRIDSIFRQMEIQLTAVPGPAGSACEDFIGRFHTRDGDPTIRPEADARKRPAGERKE
jgi:hypothetical protein